MIKHRYRKYYRKKKKKKISIFKSKVFWLTFLILIISGSLFYLFAFSSFFQVKEIKISGNEKVATNNIKDTIFNNFERKIIFFSTKSILLADLNKASEALLKNFPRIFQIELKRKFFNTLLAKIEERKPIAIFCQNDNYFLIDKEGVIFKKMPESSPGLKIKKINQTADLFLGESVVEKEEITKILKIKSKLENDSKVSLMDVSISENRLNVRTSENWEIYFNLKKDLDWQLVELKTILEEISKERRRELKYIDLRFNKIYVFPEDLLT